MRRQHAYDALEELNQLYKQMDGIYHRYARRLGLSDTAFWILYCLGEASAPLTQRELCDSWAYPPQTVNSALKGLERQGLLKTGYRTVRLLDPDALEKLVEGGD